MSGKGARRALTASSVDLARFLQHCSLEASQRFYAKGLIPDDLKKRLQKNSEEAGFLVDCLTDKVKSSPSEYAVIVDILDDIEGSSHVVQLLRDNYAKYTKKQLPAPVQVHEVRPPTCSTDDGVRLRSLATSEPKGSDFRTIQPVREQEDLSNLHRTHSQPSLPPSNYCSLGRKGAIAIAIGIVVVIASPYLYGVLQKYRKTDGGSQLHSNPTVTEPHKTTEETDCHEIHRYNDLEGYLNKIDIKPYTLCHRLELNNCNELKHSDELTPFDLAKNYMQQRPKACWEDIVRLLCENNMQRDARKAADKHGVKYDKYCTS